MGTNEDVQSRTRENCSACGSSRLSEVLSLPRFPLTGIFVPPHRVTEYPSFDQALMRCEECGQAQLWKSIDPRYLYEDTYTHRTSPSPIARSGNDFFASFVQSLTGQRRFRCMVEVGCNDLYLLRKLREKAHTALGVDPIWKGRSLDESGDIQVLGSFVEDVDWNDALPEAPDLVLSVHTLEHLDDPAAALRGLVLRASEDALFVIEVPGFDSLLMATRFDQVFHQHLNYFSLASFEALLHRIGCQYVTHAFNYKYWNGTMLVAFRKSPRTDRTHFQPPGQEQISRSYTLFKNQLDSTRKMISMLVESAVPVIGYGAAQMVPTLAYHLDREMGCLEYILDDDPRKDGLGYPGLEVVIKSTRDLRSLAGSAVLITAIDSSRRIVQKLHQLDARYVLSPFNVT